MFSILRIWGSHRNYPEGVSCAAQRGLTDQFIGQEMPFISI